MTGSDSADGSPRARDDHEASGCPLPVRHRTGLGWRRSSHRAGSDRREFFYDPFRLYRAGLLTNPNMLVVGQIGRGKSAFVKSFLWRQAAFGATRLGGRPERRVRGARRRTGV